MAKGKGKKTKEPAESQELPYPFRNDLRVITFLVAGKTATGRHFVKYLYRECGVEDADNLFPINKEQEGMPYAFGRMVYRIRTCKEVQEIAGVDPATAKTVLSLELRESTVVNDGVETKREYVEPGDPVNFWRFGVESLYRQPDKDEPAEQVKEAA